MTNKRKQAEARRIQCEAMLAQFMPVKTIARALAMGRGTISERAKRMGMARHYITADEAQLLFKRRIGGGSK
jgi:DNA invertase Pin-like site-specific DNA recombinase